MESQTPRCILIQFESEKTMKIEIQFISLVEEGNGKVKFIILQKIDGCIIMYA